MSELTIARPGAGGEYPASFRSPVNATARAEGGHQPCRATILPILKTPSGEYTFHRAVNTFGRNCYCLCTDDVTHEVREMGEPVSWWCLDHGIEEMERLTVDECRMVADAVAA